MLVLWEDTLIEGLQGTNKDFLSNNHILATAKHFIGDGGTFDGIDRGNTKLSEEELKRLHGIQYFTALDVCSQSVMAASLIHGMENFMDISIY